MLLHSWVVTSLQDPYDELLAELVFGTDDVREVVYRNLDRCDEGFNAFLENRIAISQDLEERQALRSLVDIVAAVKKATAKAEVSARFDDHHDLPS